MKSLNRRNNSILAMWGLTACVMCALHGAMVAAHWQQAMPELPSQLPPQPNMVEARLALGQAVPIADFAPYDVENLPGIGAVLGERLLAKKTAFASTCKQHAFSTEQALQQVKGIGEKKAKQIAGLVEVCRRR